MNHTVEIHCSRRDATHMRAVSGVVLQDALLLGLWQRSGAGFQS